MKNRKVFDIKWERYHFSLWERSEMKETNLAGKESAPRRRRFGMGGLGNKMFRRNAYYIIAIQYRRPCRHSIRGLRKGHLTILSIGKPCRMEER